MELHVSSDIQTFPTIGVLEGTVGNLYLCGLFYRPAILYKINSLRAKRAAATLSNNAEQVKDFIVGYIQDKKGEDIVAIDLTGLEEAVSDYFIICHAATDVQVRAIANHIVASCREELGEKPWHVEGMRNMEWVLIDFVNIVVHVFKRDRREFYRLEQLWSDGIVEEIAS